MRQSFILWFILGSLSLLLPRETLSQSIVSDLGQQQPERIIGLTEGRFAIEHDERVEIWKAGTGIIKRHAFAMPNGYQTNDVDIAVGHDGRVVAIISGTSAEKDDKWKSMVSMATCLPEANTCSYETLTERQSTDKSYYRHAFQGALISPNGIAQFKVVQSHTTEKTVDKKPVTETTKSYWIQSSDGTQEKKSFLSDTLWMTDSQGSEITFNAKPIRGKQIGASRNLLHIQKNKATSSLGPYIYSWDAALLNDDTMMVSYMNPDAESLTVAKVSLLGGKPAPQIIGLPESGLAQRMLTRPDGKAWACVYYFYRNAFYKGLKIVHQEDDRQTITDLTWEPNRNIGWNLDGAVADDGSILLTWNDDVLRGKQIFRHYPSMQALVDSGKPEPTGWEREPQQTFFLGGLGAIYDHHHLVSFISDDTPQIIDTEYDLAPALSTQAILEGKIGTTKIGATYLHSVLSDSLEDSIGVGAKRLFQVVTAFAGWEKLFLDYDVQLKFEWGRLQGAMNVPDQPNLSQAFDTNYQNLEVSLLNDFRLKIGLEFGRLNAPMPVYAWGIQSGDMRYTFLDSGIRNTEMLDFSLSLGYSLLDYTAKYEVNVFRPYIDGKLKGGVLLGIADERLEIPAGFDDEMAWELGFTLGAEIETGILLQLRSYALHGLGGFVRVGVRGRIQLRAAGGRPTDPADDDDDESGPLFDDSQYVMNLLHLSVGPFIQVGIVF